MATQQENPFPPPDWTASNVGQLRRIWTDLRPEVDDRDAERRFRDQLLSPEQAGLVFERWVLEAFRLSGHTGHYAFTLPQRESAVALEQVDGLIFDGWQGFLVESKFWTAKVDFAPIALLQALVSARPDGTMGLFFSVFGYTAPAKELTDRLHPRQVLLVEADDLAWALDQRSFKGSMVKMVRRKWMLAVKTGRSSMLVNTPLDLFN